MHDTTTMPAAERNAAAIRKFYARIDAGDIPGMCALLSPDARYSRPGYPDMTNREDIGTFYREDRVIRDGCHTLTSVVATGTDVAVHGDFNGTLRDGTAARHRFAEFFTVATDGSLDSRRTFFYVPLI
ncbi:MAG: nuclear transport factor 2 family protein [Streptosporangiaceae bacterium]